MRNNRGGVDIDSLMQMSEHYSAHAYGLGLLYTFLTQGTVSINRVVQDTLSQGWASGTGRTNAESNARGAAFSRLRERVGDAPPWTHNARLEQCQNQSMACEVPRYLAAITERAF